MICHQNTIPKTSLVCVGLRFGNKSFLSICAKTASIVTIYMIKRRAYENANRETRVETMQLHNKLNKWDVLGGDDSNNPLNIYISYMGWIELEKFCFCRVSRQTWLPGN